MHAIFEAAYIKRMQLEILKYLNQTFICPRILGVLSFEPFNYCGAAKIFWNDIRHGKCGDRKSSKISPVFS